MSSAPIVVTGMGVVSALGNDLGTFFGALCAGRCGAREVSRLAAEGLRHHQAAVVEREPILSALAPEDRDGPWATAMGIVAARAALADAGLTVRVPAAAGLFAGCSIGAPAAIDRQGLPWQDLDPADPASLSRYSQGTVIARIAERLGLQGPVACLTTTCAAGNYAIGAATDALRAGRVPLAIAGGVEEMSVLPYAAFHQIRALGTVCRPFDVHRDGILFGEGAGFLVLETLATATARGARIYAEVLSVGFANDAYNLVAPDPRGAGAALAMSRCLVEAGVGPAEVGYVNAHGTGTPLNDPAEARALAAVFGAAVKDLAVSSTKGATGHTMAAASAVEAIATILALRHGQLPPTTGLAEPDPSLPFDAIRERPRLRSITVALSAGLGFGGNDAVLAVARPGRTRPEEPRRPVFIHGGAALVGQTLGARAVLARLAGKVSVSEAQTRATFDPATLLGKKGLRHVDRGALLLAATLEHDLACWPTVPADRAGAVFGSAFPAYGTVMAILRECQAHGAAQVNPTLVPFATANCASSWWLIRRGLRGFSGSVGADGCAGLDAICLAWSELERGRVDAVVAGGVEAYCVELWEGLRRLKRFPGRCLSEGVGAVTLGVDRAGAWAELRTGTSAFDRARPERARELAWQQALEMAALSEVDLAVMTHGAGVGFPAREVVAIDEILGETQGAAGALAVLLAARRLADAPTSIRTALVVADSAEGYATALLLTAVTADRQSG
jgi:3-oxoacyl-(acyl-carrier-protein) synthase